MLSNDDPRIMIQGEDGRKTIYALKPEAIETLLEDVDVVTANQVLYYYGSGGYSAGAFMGNIYRAFDCADLENRMRLAIAFPAQAAAMTAITGFPNGVDRLREIANG